MLWSRNQFFQTKKYPPKQRTKGGKNGNKVRRKSPIKKPQPRRLFLPANCDPSSPLPHLIFSFASSASPSDPSKPLPDSSSSLGVDQSVRRSRRRGILGGFLGLRTPARGRQDRGISSGKRGLLRPNLVLRCPRLDLGFFGRSWDGSWWWLVLGFLDGWTPRIGGCVSFGSSYRMVMARD